VIKSHGGWLMRWRGARLDVCEVSTRLRGGPTGRRLGRRSCAVDAGLSSYGIDASPHEVEGA
jgi:hypothetical protein